MRHLATIALLGACWTGSATEPAATAPAEPARPAPARPRAPPPVDEPVAKARPGWTKVVILGLEVVGPGSATIDRDAQALTSSLMDAARADGSLHPSGVSRQLIDEKLLGNCAAEHLVCMSAIGRNLGADVLIYGRIDRLQSRYQVTLRALSVARKAMLTTWTGVVDPGALPRAAHDAYRRLAGIP